MTTRVTQAGNQHNSRQKILNALSDMKTRFAVLFAASCALVQVRDAAADELISNLGNVWPTGGIGDIHGLFHGSAPKGDFIARFTTGGGSYSLDSFTLQFAVDTGYPAGAAAPDWVSLKLFQGSSLVGGFGNPVADPRPTQWPQSAYPGYYTEFIGFSPLLPITLDPLTEYSVVVSMSAGSTVDAGLLFTPSPAYTTSDGWSMGETTTGNAFAVGQYLSMEVAGKAVPELSNTAMLLTGGVLVFLRSARERSSSRSRA